MAPEKVTEMVLNVDLKCSGCYKKVKKVICKIPQIRDQVFDVDKNKVKVIVVCCSPEKIRDKLCYKGGGAIQSIEIVEKSEKPKAAADKPKEAEKPKEVKPAADKPAAGKPKEAEKPKDAGKPKEAEKPKAAADKPKDGGKPPEAKPKDGGKPPEAKPKDGGKPPEAKPKDAGKPPEAKPKDAGKPPEGKPKEAEKPKQADAPKKVEFAPLPGAANPEVAKMVYEPVHGYPQMYPQSAYPMVSYGQFYDQSYGGAPYHQHGYGMPVAPPPPPPSYGGFGYEHGGYNNGYNGNRGHYSSNDYGGEEEGEGCSIM